MQIEEVKKSSTDPKHNIITQFKTLKTRINSTLTANLTTLTKKLSMCKTPEDNSSSESFLTKAKCEMNEAVDICEDKQMMKKLILSVHASMIPHPDKRKKGGEDAYFISGNSRAFGVADGVGGWADRGIDPSLYSKTLMKESKRVYDENRVVDPKDILKNATLKANKVIGSATACVAVLDDTDAEHPKLRSANVGDSGFIIIRNNEVIFKTKEQQFSFNFPYQLGATTRAKPDDADMYDLEIQESDVIVMGSDGLFDNLFEQEIAEIVKKYGVTAMPIPVQEIDEESNSKRSSKDSDESLFYNSSHPEDVCTLADMIAKKAYSKAKNPYAKTPFAKHAKENGYVFPGGKLDDITVMVAQVVAEQQQIPVTSEPIEIKKSKSEEFPLAASMGDK